MQRSRREVRENTPPPRELPWFKKQVGGLPVGVMVAIVVLLGALGTVIGLRVAGVLPTLL